MSRQLPAIAATRSVRELKGLFEGKRKQPVSVEEMNAAIAKRASGTPRSSLKRPSVK